MARRLAELPGDTILDVASGTGDIPLRLLRLSDCAGRTIHVTDLSPAMLAMARRRLGDDGRCVFALADAERLHAHADGSIDLFSISFGMKIVDRAQVMSEALRVLKPGGLLLCLEAARIPWPWAHSAYLIYMGWCLPMIARIAVGGDPSAYDYLLRGIHQFPGQADFAKELTAAGFTSVKFENLTFGIVALHTATKPSP